MRNDSDDEDMEVDDGEVLDPLQPTGVALKSVSVFDEVFARLKL